MWDALHDFGALAKRMLILTATPFSIELKELEQLLRFVGASGLEPVGAYARDLNRLYTLGDERDAAGEAKRLVDAARAAVDALQAYVIRHRIKDLPQAERTHFEGASAAIWKISASAATREELSLLLRMDRVLQLTQEAGKRRNDPRFHVGWRHVSTELDRAAERAADHPDSALHGHVARAKQALSTCGAEPHPKIAAVRDAIRPLLDAGEKTLVFCHHHATASELLSALETSLKSKSAAQSDPPREIWREAWKFLLAAENPLVTPIIDWLCSPGLRSQVGGWLSEPAGNTQAPAAQLEKIRPRNAGSPVPTIFEAAKSLKEKLLDKQSKSTRALLSAIARGRQSFGGEISHFPGQPRRWVSDDGRMGP